MKTLRSEQPGVSLDKKHQASGGNLMMDNPPSFYDDDMRKWA